MFLDLPLTSDFRIPLQISNRIVHHIPKKDLAGVEAVTLASSHVTSMVYHKLKKASKHNVVWFLQHSAGSKNCSTMRGILFEEYVVDHQSEGGDVRYECKSHSMDKQAKGIQQARDFQAFRNLY